jgi:signal transduction histidine kinase
MNAATPFPWSDPPVGDSARTSFRSIFEHSPVAAARCDQTGVILERNLAFEQALDPELVHQSSLGLRDLVSLQERDATESLLRELFDGVRDSIRMDGGTATPSLVPTNWTAWRQPGTGDEATHLFVIGERTRMMGPPEDSLLQAQRWEAVGRLAGGVVHDFNNLLTGVMLYCDLLLSSLDSQDRRRRYADEIRSAVIQATGLVKQLLIFARPPARQLRLLSLNRIIEAMRDILSRLIGENIVLEFRLDPDLGLIRIDQAQAQQILLNLVLNARDALPEGGRIVVETSNCKFQTVAGSRLARQGAAAFPCVLLAVGDNGLGMDTKTRQRLFEPFFKTKSAGKGTGLGLTTVRSIVTASCGLIHVESEPGRGTRVMILLPRASQSPEVQLQNTSLARTEPSPPPLQEARKESLYDVSCCSSHDYNAANPGRQFP